MADPAADMDADAEHREVIAAADTQLPAAASESDFFTVCLNPAVTKDLSDSDCDAFKREFADWYPGPVLLQPGRDITLKPMSLDCTYLNGRAGTVVKHLAEDPRIVTVHVAESKDWLAEEIKVLYSILKFSDPEGTSTIQPFIEALLSDSPAADAGTAVTLIGYNEFICGDKTEREYWLSLSSAMRLPLKAGEFPVHVNPTGRWNLCVVHVQYKAFETSMSEVERVSLRETPSIELRAHQDKCRTCTLCAKRKDCAKCKDSYTAHARCTAHDDCHHCPEFKWRDVYGRQFRNEQCHILTSILSDANSCTLESRLSLDDAHQRRFAFIVGNTQYLGEANGSIFRPLGDVVGNDTIDICHQLQRFGFQVHNDEPLLNQNKSDLEHEVAKWTRSLPENAEALVFLSGHGMKLQGKHYFVSIDYTTHTHENIVETAQQQCITLEWIQDLVLGLALRSEGLLMSFWDCCRENALEQMEVVRSSGLDPLIRNTDKLIWKLKQKTSRSAGQLTVFASASGALAHQEQTGGILAKALLTWWRHDDYAARQVGDAGLRLFVLESIRRQQTSQEQQEPQWVYDGGNINFVFKQRVSSNAGEMSQVYQTAHANLHMQQQQEQKKGKSMKPGEEQQMELHETPMYYVKFLQQKRPRPQEKGSAVCPHEAIDDEKLAAIFGTVFHDNSRVVVDVAREFRKRDVSSLFDEVAWDLSIATFCAFSDFPYRGKVEREYWMALSRDALSAAHAGLAGSDGLAILHVHYLEKWPHQGQLKMISQINIRHTWNGIGDRWYRPCIDPGGALDGKWREAHGEPVVVDESGWNWMNSSQKPKKSTTINVPALIALLQKGQEFVEDNGRTVRGKNTTVVGGSYAGSADGSTVAAGTESVTIPSDLTSQTQMSTSYTHAHFSKEKSFCLQSVSGQQQVAVDWQDEPAWDDLPAPPTLPERFCIMFVGANNNDEAKLSLEREVETMEDAFTVAWGGES